MDLVGDIFSEVDEDVRRDQVIRLWKRYGRYFVALLAIIVVGTGANVAWNHMKTKRIMADGSKFSAAVNLVQNGEYEQAALRFSEQIANSGAGYSQLARLQKAAALIAIDDHTGAISIYDSLADTPSTDRTIADLAVILGGIHRIDADRADEATARLLELSEGKGPWRHLARETRALALLKSGNEREARELLASLVGDPTSPPGIRSRATAILGTLSPNPS